MIVGDHPLWAIIPFEIDQHRGRHAALGLGRLIPRGPWAARNARIWSCACPPSATHRCHVRYPRSPARGAWKEVWGKIFGTIDTREKFLDHRLELASHEWARMKANDSLECRNCHSAQSMDITRQSPRAIDQHQRFLFTGQKTCIDCHKGIAHHLPDMRGVPGWQ